MCRDQKGQSEEDNLNMRTSPHLPHLLDVIVAEHLREVLLGLGQNVQSEERRPAGRHNIFQFAVEICSDTRSIMVSF